MLRNFMGIDLSRTRATYGQTQKTGRDCGNIAKPGAAQTKKTNYATGRDKVHLIRVSLNAKRAEFDLEQSCFPQSYGQLQIVKRV
jgi:hypothetical protein